MAELDRELGEITAKLEHIQSGQTAIYTEFQNYRRDSSEYRDKMHMAIQDLNSSCATLHADHSGLKEGQEAHVKDDNRRFSLIWRVILGGGGMGALVSLMLKAFGH